MIGYHGDGTTILAIASPPGHGQRGVIRLSGPGSWAAVSAFLDSDSRPAPRAFVRRTLELPAIGNRVAVRLAWMPAPRSYTREDVVELHTYGSPILLSLISDALQERGVHLAGPGEFTRRAFLNGRIDLTRAEAVLSVIHAQDEADHRQAFEHLSGTLHERIQKHKESLVRVCAFAEAAIDFSDQDIDVIDHGWVGDRIQEALADVEDLLSASRQASPAREGIRTLLLGAPNVGKSSLMNRLSDTQTALVSDIAGTTRDVIEASILLDGHTFLLRDAAGVRETSDALESEGVERTRATMRSADVTLLVLDGSRLITTDDENLAASVGREAIVVVNKCDLPRKLVSIPPAVSGATVVEVSARTGDGLRHLTAALLDAIHSRPDLAGHAFSVNARQRGCLVRAKESLERASASAGSGESLEFLSLDLRESLDALAEVVGEVVTDDLLDVIFSEFCIGK